MSATTSNAVPSWRECVNWLSTCGALPPGHRLRTECAQPEDLAIALRDGIMLCRLLNHLLPHTINTAEEVNLLPRESEYISLNNLNVFAQHVQAEYDIKFDIVKIYFMTHFEVTLESLSALSKATANQTGVPGFPVTGELDTFTYPDMNPEQHLAEHYDDYVSLSDEYQNIYGFIDEDDSVYASIDTRVASPPMPQRHQIQSHAHQVAEAREEQFCVIEELVTREKKFVNDLRIISQVIIPMFKPPVAMPPFDFNKMFMVTDSDKLGTVSVFDALYQAHRNFLILLNSAFAQVNKTDNEGLLEIFQAFKCWHSWYRCYSIYMSHLSTSRASMEELVKCNKMFAGKVESAQSRFQRERDISGAPMTGASKLPDVLTLPFNVVTKYTELLKRVQRIQSQKLGMPKSDPVCMEVKKAKRVVQACLNFANEYTAGLEWMKGTIMMERKIINLPSFLEHTRLGERRVDGQLRVQDTSGRWKQMSAFLFDTCMILCHQIGTTGGPPLHPPAARPTVLDSEYKSFIDLRKQFSLKLLETRPYAREWSYQWMLTVTVTEGAAPQVTTFCCRTMPETLKWSEPLAAIAKDPAHRYVNSHRFASVPLAVLYTQKLIRCLICDRYIANFAWMCRYCGLQLHAQCCDSPNLRACDIGCAFREGGVRNSLSPSFPWWGGVMNVNDVSRVMEAKPDGTFMIRAKMDRSDLKFRLSRKLNDTLMHLELEDTHDRFAFKHQGNWEYFVALTELASYAISSGGLVPYMSSNHND